ncbi:MAG: alpha amylase C-terminal domain-containing protein [Planctomycetes bacterium]|nr:alpha amylase C-terminal domain-containing protein [Planctomycetota bacterium]
MKDKRKNKKSGSRKKHEITAEGKPVESASAGAAEVIPQGVLCRDYPYLYFGAHPSSKETVFRVHAPEATEVSLLREANNWNPGAETMNRLEDGTWEITIPEDLSWTGYKYHIKNTHDYLDHEYSLARIDPFSPQLAVNVNDDGGRVYNSVVVDQDNFEWTHKAPVRTNKPMSIYELHLGAFWNGGYREIAEKLVEHLEYLGFTHVQIMPPFQTPIHESWGYLIGSPYAINERYGTLDDFKYLVNLLHEKGYGVIVDIPLGFGIQDWDCGLANYDGTDLYHHVGPRGWNNQWKTRIYNTSVPYVRNYLIGICTYLNNVLGVDGARLDAVAAQLFYDYDRGEWDWPRNDREKVSEEDWNIFNGAGGDMYLDKGYWVSEATDFDGLRFYRDLHLRLKHTAPGFFTIAEESRRVFKRLAVPTEKGGLGFTYAQNMGEMHRVRKYLSYPVEQRKIEEIEHIMLSPFEERFVNAMNTHDECANGKRRLVTELGNHLQLIGLAAFCWFRPGAPMIFMGDEFCEEGVFDVWNYLDWSKTGPQAAMHQQQMTNNIHDLNWILTHEPAMANQESWSLERIGSNNEYKYFSFIRWGEPAKTNHKDNIIYIRNESPFALPVKADIHIPCPGEYQVIYNSIDERYIGRQGYNEHDPYWSAHADGILWVDLLPYQNIAMKLKT